MSKNLSHRSTFHCVVAMAAGISTLSGTSFAATADVPFTGAILSICSLTVGVPGVITPNATYDELSSANAGGTNGAIAALTTGSGFSVTTEAPSNFTLSPTGGGTNVTFASSYSATGVTTISLSAGATVTPLNVGLTTVSVQLEATKSTGTFPAGAYSAEVLVRCE